MKFKLWLEVSEMVMPKLFDRVKQLKGEHSGVHFSKSDQLSFNLQPNHFDPIGIYVFPKKYLLEGGLSANTMFAAYPYAFLIEPSEKANILNLNMDYRTAENLLEKMGVDKSLLYDKEVYHKSGSDSPGHRFWGALENFRNVKRNFKNLGRNVSWNTLFSKTGYNALYDPGLKIIHTNEPAQVIYLDHKAYRVVDIIRNTNKHSLLLNFASYFPDFRIYKKRSGWSRDEYSIKLQKDGIEITTWTSKNSPNSIGIKVYGFGERYTSKEWYVQINSKEDLIKTVGEVKSYMEKSERTPPNPYLLEASYEIMKKISNLYRLKMDPEYPGIISKRYKHDTKFEIKYSPSSENISLHVESKSLWARYYYYYETKATSPEDSMKTLFSGLKENIKKDLDDETSRKKYDAPYAMRFVEFLEKRVFVKRNHQ